MIANGSYMLYPSNQTANQTKSPTTNQTPSQTVGQPQGAYYMYVGSVANPAYMSSQGFPNPGYVYDQKSLMNNYQSQNALMPYAGTNVSTLGQGSRSSTMVRSAGSSTSGGSGFKAIQQPQIVYLPPEDAVFWK